MVPSDFKGGNVKQYIIMPNNVYIEYMTQIFNEKEQQSKEGIVEGNEDNYWKKENDEFKKKELEDKKVELLKNISNYMFNSYKIENNE